MARKKYKKPNFFVYYFFKFCCWFMSKIMYRCRVTKNDLKGKKGPFLLISNHESHTDFFNIYPAVPGRAHFVISYSFYKTSSIRRVMDKCGLIPKQQFQTTPKEMKQMKSAIKNNMPLIICPVGLMSENGMSTNPGITTSGLVKFLETDVYICKVSGSYLTHPKWTNKRRRGRVNLEITKLYDKEQLDELSNEQIYSDICERIKYNAYDYQEKVLYKFKRGDNVEGLNYVIHQCPDCKAIKAIEADNNTLRCSHCGYEVKADKYGLLNLVKGNNFYRKPSDWYLWMQDNIAEEIKCNPTFTYESHGAIHMIDEKTSKFTEVGSGTVTLNKEIITLKGIVNNEPIDVELITSNYILLPYKPGRHIELQQGMNIYRIVFDNPYDASLFNMYLKELNNNKN